MKPRLTEIQSLLNTGYAGLICMSGDGKVMLCQRRPYLDVYPNHWSVPTTTRERLEGAGKASLRAFHKDTTIKFTDKSRHQYITRIQHNNGFLYLYLYTVEKTFRVWPTSVKYTRWQWFPLDDLPTLITPEVSEGIRLAQSLKR